ncbi:MAG: transglycosylase domain-containing protein [Chloroflexi bacterium]|nr:transglycosylase domain-containing protein [Chloroflexota bacterium]
MDSNKIRFIQSRQRRRHRPAGRNMIWVRVFLILAVALLVSFLGLLGAGVTTTLAVYTNYAATLPPASEIGRQAQQAFKTTRIYDRTGTVLLYEVFDPQGGNRTWVPLNRIPKYFRDAVVANEDRRFYDDSGTFFGIDPIGLARAARSTLTGEQVQGASGITQQLVRNVVMAPDERYQVSIERKLKEAVLAIETNRRFSKDEILEMYLNTIPYGRLAFGVEAAAQAYFGKHVEELTLAESVSLALVPQFPAANSPCDDNPQRADAQRKRELAVDAMLREGYISETQAVEAKFTPIKCYEQVFDISAPHFVFYVRKQLEEQFGAQRVYQGGLKVTTTLDMDWQNEAERLAREQVVKLTAEKKNVTNAAVVAIDPRTGEIKTMVGSIDYFNRQIDGQVNIALANRQPGSSFKLFTYLAALQKGYTPATLLMDVRQSFPDPPNPPYVPENYDRTFHGPQSLRQAIARSYNVPAVKTLSLVGVKPVVTLAHSMGINTLDTDKQQYGLALTLGGGEVSLLDLTYAYGVVANSGAMAGQPVPSTDRRPGYREVNPVSILRVEDPNGELLYEYKKPEIKEVLDPRITYLMSDILSDNQARTAAFGANSALKLSRPAAAKTGTTNDFKDNWTLGFTPQLVIGVWAGNSDNSSMERSTGLTGAGPIWHDFMEFALKDMPVEQFKQPQGIAPVEVCATSGLLPTPYCPNKVKELFIQGTEPKTPDNIWQAYRVCKPTGKLATVYCPADQVETKVFAIYPPEAADWVRENNIAQPPTDYDTTYGPGQTVGDVAIIAPKTYGYVHGMVPIMGNAKSGEFQLYRLEYGAGLDPTSWIQIGGNHNNLVNNGQLESWDTSNLDGLYTLNLIVVDGNGTRRQSSVQVQVDNKPPTVRMLNPNNNEIYLMEDKEWINLQADARDNLSMERVEFYIDDQQVGFSTVAPFTRRWIITMQDKRPVPGEPVVKRVDTITNTDGTRSEVEVTVSETITQANGRYLKRFNTGMTVISDTFGYTETHQVYVKAFDAAGNMTESPKINVFIAHAPKKTSYLRREEPPALERRDDHGRYNS